MTNNTNQRKEALRMDLYGSGIMESWRKAWRDGFVPQLTTTGLQSLADALQRNDHRLMQNYTCFPSPISCNADLPIERCCAIGWTGWQTGAVATVADIDEYFARACFEADKRLGEPGGCRWFLNWFDDGPRGQVFAELLAEVRHNIADRRVIEFDRAAADLLAITADEHVLAGAA